MSEKTDELVEELGYIPAKTKTPQPQDINESQGRDMFQTPDYAVNLLLPFIPKDITNIWECAAGFGKIYRFLSGKGYEVYPTDINPQFGFGGFNFLKDKLTWTRGTWAIVTNPPFSLKRQFYFECLKYKVPFALLIPADYSGWIIKACQDGAEKIIPTRRIDYITPSGLSGETGHTADFHSMWLTKGFNLGRTETFVELSLKEKKENI